MQSFTLDPRLANDTIDLGSLNLCRVLLMNEERYPWLILVPERANVSEVFDLEDHDGQRLWSEVHETSHAMKQAFSARKMNVAAIGNRVAQLHVHIIARLESDTTWPGVVWDKGPAQPMTEKTKANRISTLSQHLRFSVVR